MLHFYIKIKRHTLYIICTYTYLVDKIFIIVPKTTEVDQVTLNGGQFGTRPVFKWRSRAV